VKPRPSAESGAPQNGVSIALVYRNFGVRGSLERDHVFLARALAARGFAVHCFGLPERRTATDDTVVHHDVRARVSRGGRLGYAVECATFAWHATRAIRALRGQFAIVDVSGTDCWEQDVVTVHAVGKAEDERVAELSARDRFRTTLAPVLAPRQLHVAAVERLQFRNPRLQRAITRTDEVKRDVERIHGFPGDRIDVVPYAVDLDAFATGARGWLRPRLGIAPSAHVVAFIGRRAKEKGINEAILALRQLPEDVHLVAAGSGDAQPLRELARAAGVGGRLHLLDYTEHPEDVYADADVLICPSRRDVWGIPVIEAMAAGLPIVCSSGAGASAAVTAAEAGVVVPPDPAALAAALDTLLGDRARMAALGANGRIGARRYGPEAYVDAVLRCYATTVEQRAASVGDVNAMRAIAALGTTAQR
jgi:glycosyltransferase involved in cell wall biosynthesis